MDSAILSATSALVGSLVGGVSTLAASWLSQRGQLRAQTLVQEAVKHEALYAEFIIETSRRLAEARDHLAEGPEVVARLYSAVSRMRLTSSDEVIRISRCRRGCEGTSRSRRSPAFVSGSGPAPSSL